MARTVETTQTRSNSPSYSSTKSKAVSDQEALEARNIKIGKMIFYLTCAIGIYFFYWFNGIQCPC